MNTVLKIFLSMSFSGGLLILTLLLGSRFLKDKISRQWQYYIWLVVVLRLLLPFGPEINMLGKTYQAVDQAMTRTALQTQQLLLSTSEGSLTPTVDLEQNNENVNSPAEDLTTAHPLQDIGALLTDHIWLIWLVVALGLLIRRVTIYQSFIRYIKAGLTPVSDIEMLDRLSGIVERAGIKKPIELCVNPLISSPLLIGFFHPCIVLPSADISEKDFQYIVLHELTHYKRRDMLYKWLVQVTVCLHWFNPLVHLMSREITKACEFSCDEAVLTKMGGNNAQDYGKTLLDAMAAVGRYKEDLGAVTLSENKQLLKERIEAIMDFKKKSTSIRVLTGVLTICIIFGAAFVGVYPVAAASNQKSGQPPVSGNNNSTLRETGAHSGDYTSQAERYYEADSLPLFEIAFSRLDESAQKTWLEKIYADEEIAFFSTLADYMDETELEFWLDRALEDEKWNFQSVLFNALDRDDKFDELEEQWEKEWEEALRAEYQTVGVTMDGNNYYYQGQLVNIFLDIRANKSVYTLNINPGGTVNIKIIRNSDNKITGVAYMTDEEVTSLLGDMDDDDELDDMDDIDDWREDFGGRVWHPQVIPVDQESMADKEI